jgi:RNA polymerase sigma factor (TIGR02999 family)
MQGPSSDEVTELLRAWNGGDQTALEKLIPLVDRELRMLARSYLRREPPGHELETTALINETFLRLIDGPEIEWQSLQHFFAIAARNMRQILIEHARNQLVAKRGGDPERVPVMNDARNTEKAMELLELDEALKRLAEVDQRKSTVVELRYFGGLTIGETAQVLHVSQVTVQRDWRLAKAWLKRHLAREETSELDDSISSEEPEIAKATEDAERRLAEAWSNRELVTTLMSKNWAGLKLLVQLRLRPNVATTELVSVLGIHTRIIDSLLFKLGQCQVLEKQHNIFTLTDRGYVLLEAFEKAIGKNLNE